MYDKDFFQSKTTWGAIILLVSPLLHMLGVQFDNAALTDALTSLAGIVVVAWGQLTRNSTISSVAGIQVKTNAQP